jgi:hypothetical protein
MAVATQDLERFVRDALTQGQSRPQIEAILAQAGWPPEQVRDALSMYADVAFPLPVPRPRPSLSAREAFFYLVLFAALYLWAFHTGSLLFDLINHAFPDASRDDVVWSRGHQSMRWSVAWVLIAYPVFLLVARKLSRELAHRPIKRLSAVRRWLTYLTLFIAATTLLCDMAVLVFNLLGGELSVRFVLKVLVVAVLAGGIFSYYLLDLRREEVEA